jgi:hypothetical protein
MDKIRDIHTKLVELEDYVHENLWCVYGKRIYNDTKINAIWERYNTTMNNLVKEIRKIAVRNHIKLPTMPIYEAGGRCLDDCGLREGFDVFPITDKRYKWIVCGTN